MKRTRGAQTGTPAPRRLSLKIDRVSVALSLSRLLLAVMAGIWAMRALLAS
jgi:hypothetical protein